MDCPDIFNQINTQFKLITNLYELIDKQNIRLAILEKENSQFKLFINKFYNNYIDFSINQEIHNKSISDQITDIEHINLHNLKYGKQ